MGETLAGKAARFARAGRMYYGYWRDNEEGIASHRAALFQDPAAGIGPCAQTVLPFYAQDVVEGVDLGNSYRYCLAGRNTPGQAGRQVCIEQKVL